MNASTHWRTFFLAGVLGCSAPVSESGPSGASADAGASDEGGAQEVDWRAALAAPLQAMEDIGYGCSAVPDASGHFVLCQRADVLRVLKVDVLGQRVTTPVEEGLYLLGDFRFTVANESYVARLTRSGEGRALTVALVLPAGEPFSSTVHADLALSFDLALPTPGRSLRFDFGQGGVQVTLLDGAVRHHAIAVMKDVTPLTEYLALVRQVLQGQTLVFRSGSSAGATCGESAVGQALFVRIDEVGTVGEELTLSARIREATWREEGEDWTLHVSDPAQAQEWVTETGGKKGSLSEVCSRGAQAQGGPACHALGTVEGTLRREWGVLSLHRNLLLQPVERWNPSAGGTGGTSSVTYAHSTCAPESIRDEGFEQAFWSAPPGGALVLRR